MVANRQIFTQVLLNRGGTDIDIAPYVTRIEVNLGNVSSLGTGASGGDGVVRQAFITIQNDNVNRFSPLDANSSWNYDGMTFDPLLKPNREIKIMVAAISPGSNPSPSDWELLFHGLLGDSIRTEGQVIEIEARDMAKRLQDRMITVTREYGAPIDDGGVRADLVMQQILDDEFGVGVITLNVPVLPTFACPPFTVEFVSVWDILQSIAAEMGWFLGYRYDKAAKVFKLTLMEPPRNKTALTADWHFDWNDDIYVQDLDITDRDIRNRVVVVYRDLAGKRQSVTVEDAVSIAEYGLKAMQIDETDTQLIKTSTAALALANYALEDLAEQSATNSLTLPFLPLIDLYDGITVDDPRISSITEFYGVESVRHTLDFNDNVFQTEVIASGKVIGSHQRWLMMQARKGSEGEPPSDVWPVRPNTVLTVAAYNTPDEGKKKADIRCQGHDDQRDINRALQAVGAFGTVVLLEGDFEISDQIIIPSNRTLLGQGSTTIINLEDNYGSSLLGMVINEDTVSGDSGIVVRDIVINGNKANQDPTDLHIGMQFTNVSDLEISGCTFTNCTGSGLSLENCHGAKVITCRSFGNFDNGYVFYQCDNIIFSNCEAFNLYPDPLSGTSPGAALLLQVNSSTVTGCTFSDSQLGLLLSSSNDCTITGNTISSIEYIGIQIQDSDGNSIISNTVTGCGRNGIALFFSDDNIINGNSLICNGIEDPPLIDYAQIRLQSSNRNNIQNNSIRKGSGASLAVYGIHIQSGCEDNFVTNNDLLDAALSLGLFDEGIRTVTMAGNRPNQGFVPITYHTSFTEWPVGETPFDWFGWHTQDYLSQVYIMIEDGAPALFIGMNSGNLWRVWGPKDAPAARNIELFCEFKITDLASGNMNPFGLWMRVSGWNESRVGGIFVAADGSDFAIKRRNFTTFTTLASASGVVSANVWYKVRFRAEEQDFYAKIWESDDPEPNSWTITASENTGDHMTGARIGIGNGVSTASAYFRQFSYAVGGGTAPSV